MGSPSPGHQKGWQNAVKYLAHASSLDAKTESLVYTGILAATRLDNGLSFHVAEAHGAMREEITSAVLAGLPAVGNVVIQFLSIALQAYDS